MRNISWSGIALMAVLFAAVLCGSSASAQIVAETLRCEYLTDPLAIEEPKPRLSWTLRAHDRGQWQTAYRVVVASSKENLAGGNWDVWDSGRVESSQTAHVEFGGRVLASRERCFWKVMAWDRDGAAGAWSEVAFWEMGLLRPEDWVAQWIEAEPRAIDIEIVKAEYCTLDGSVRRDVTALVALLVAKGESWTANNEALGGDPAYGVRKRLEVRCRIGEAEVVAHCAENARVMLPQHRYPYLRRTFEVDRPVRSARLYATALGVYEMQINGQRVGDHHLAPGWTDYRKRVRYQVFDVTEQLKKGDNVIGAMVGPGWFAGRAGLFHARAFYGSTPALLAQLEVTYEDGSVERVVTDGLWRRHDGPLLAADLMDGETHDATAEIVEWSAPAVSDAAWETVQTREENRTLVTEVDQPVRVVALLPARSVTEPIAGRYTFDMGQNMVGVVRLRVAAPRGTVITIRHAEMLNPDGTIYTANLRGAAATDVYICRGDGVEEWQPRFTFHGFRYVELEGLPTEPGLGTVTGMVLATDLPEAGTFACSDDALNQLHSNIVWGFRGNALSIPTDCPQRDERMGWMGDAQVFAPTAAYITDVAAFMSKWMTDVRDAQRADGAHADVAPVMHGLNYGTPAWGDAGTIVPWSVYQAFGDTRVLEHNIESMMRWVEWSHQSSTDLIRDKARGNDYGDWLSVNANTPKDLIGTAYFAHSTDITARALRVLGRDAEAEEHEQLFDSIRAAFARRYIDSDGRVAGQTQCGYLLALRFGLVPQDLREAAFGHLVHDLESRDWHLSTGFVGVSHLLAVLSEGGRDDLAYRLLMQDTFPSWLFSVRHGATTIWERWDGWTPEGGVHPDPGMNSFNHFAFGSCGAWMYEAVGGIARPSGEAGFSRFEVRPRVKGPLAWVRASHNSIQGRIETEWRRDGERLMLSVTVPVNTTARVLIPADAASDVLESGVALVDAPGVEMLGREAGAVVVRVGSGRYDFVSRIR